ncbi:MAG TPA: hypothetical protein VGP46_05710 [Acidimicrobiales bacterium]|jgi:hypothetical protein|nr:hypothetical protein [Acidimicrobiales bacterium]
MSTTEIDEFLGRQLAALTDDFADPVTVGEVIRRVRSGNGSGKRRRLMPAAPPVHSPLVLVATGCVLVIALVAGLLLVHENGSSRPTVPLSSYRGAIQQLSEDYAAADGDSRPTSVSWVATTGGRAGSLFGAGPTGSAVPVFALQVAGTFSEPSGQSGPDLWLVVTQSSWEVTTDMISQSAVNIAGLGSPVVDSLAGLTPESEVAWGAEFHHPVPLLSQAIDQWAVNIASHFGDDHPTTVTWVAGNAALAQLLFPATATALSPQIYVLEVEGNYYLPAPGSPLTGKVLVAFPSRSDWGGAEGTPQVGLVPSLQPEYRLGTPATDTLYGLSPMSPSAFVAKYKHVRGVTLKSPGNTSPCFALC